MKPVLDCVILLEDAMIHDGIESLQVFYAEEVPFFKANHNRSQWIVSDHNIMEKCHEMTLVISMT